MTKSCKHGGYAFGDFRLDPGKRMLYRGEDEVSLPPKVVETLIVLVQNQGEIISKADLMEKVWSGSVVEEQNVSQHLYLLRKTLGRTANGRPVIETLRRRGYRFSAEAVPIDAEVASEFEPSPHPSAAYSVRRRGNVVTVTDWEAAPDPVVRMAPVPATSADGPQRRRSPRVATLAGLVSLALVGAATAFWFLSRPNGANPASASDIQTSFLTNGRPVQGLAISPDGNYFVYDEVDGTSSHLWLQQTGQAGRVEIELPGERWIGPKTFSHDGQFVYFVAREKGDEQETLYRVPTLGGLHSKILENVSTAITFSPDGKEMAFVRYEKGRASAMLVVAPSDGGAERVVLKFDGKRTLGPGSAWSPDGRLVAFSSIEPDEMGIGHGSLGAVDPVNGNIVSLSPEKWDTAYRMQWTKDGRGLVFIGTKEGESNSSRRDQIYYLSYPDGSARKLTNEGNRHEPASLSVTTNDEILVLPQGRSSQIWVMDSGGDSRSAVQITRGLLDGRAGIAPLPDGRVGYIARTGENVNAWIMNADGTGQRQLTTEPSFVEELRASPDGSFFIFSGVKDRKSHLFRIRPDGTGQMQLTAGNGSEVDSSVSPDGNSIIYGASIFDVAYGKTFIWKVSSDGGPPEQVSQSECSTPHFSPDGKRVSCVTGANTIDVLRVADGNVITTLTPRPLSRLNFGARWTPDGSSLAYISLEKGTANLWIHPLSDGQPVRLTDFSGGDIYNFAFSIDGRQIFLARGHPIHDAMLIKNFR